MWQILNMICSWPDWLQHKFYWYGSHQWTASTVKCKCKATLMTELHLIWSLTDIPKHVITTPNCLYWLQLCVCPLLYFTLNTHQEWLAVHQDRRDLTATGSALLGDVPPSSQVSHNSTHNLSEQRLNHVCAGHMETMSHIYWHITHRIWSYNSKYINIQVLTVMKVQPVTSW